MPIGAKDLDMTALNAEYKSMKKAMDAVRKPLSFGGSKSFAAYQERAKDKVSDDFVSGWLNQVPKSCAEF